DYQFLSPFAIVSAGVLQRRREHQERSSPGQLSSLPIGLLFREPEAVQRERAMYAVFEDGSRQYRVSEGDLVKVDYREADVGSRLEFGHVLLYAGGDDLRIGQPAVDGARVLGEVVEHVSTKTHIQKFRRRKNERRHTGHRQHYVLVRVSNILLPGQETPPHVKKEEKPKKEKTPAGEAKSEAAKTEAKK